MKQPFRWTPSTGGRVYPEFSSAPIVDVGAGTWTYTNRLPAIEDTLSFTTSSDTLLFSATSSDAIFAANARLEFYWPVAIQANLGELTLNGDAALTIRYDYEAVPEPGSGSMVLLSLISGPVIRKLAISGR
jgi:hypothetical protein